MTRRYPIGAECEGGGASFRVWAPDCETVEVVLEGRSPVPLPKDGDEGYFAAHIAGARAGQLYRYRLDGDAAKTFPDPASRFQPDGPHGPSRIIDPSGYTWGDAEWRGVPPERRVVYEMHVGTFTLEGTFEAAARELGHLAALGITLVEVMPVADFGGQFGWGYDGVNMWAPTRLYGEPDAFRAFVDAAHAEGVGVILDVVYNHLGPDGNYLTQFAKDYFTTKYSCEWGAAINFDGRRSRSVREFFAENAAYWVDEYHLDGLRFDATQSIHDETLPHVICEFTRRAREAARGRPLFLVAECEAQEARLARTYENGGYGMDALWNDDFHHSAVVALTGKSEAYYSDTLGKPQELISAVRWGYLFQGQRHTWQKNRRGHAAFDLGARAFVSYLENHDQVANTARGTRLHQRTSPGGFRALTALTLLGPATPMLFQGQEFASTRPFLFFADHDRELARAVRTGRAAFLAQFPSMTTTVVQAQLHDPASRETFERCKLDPEERTKNAGTLALHRDLLALRRHDHAFAAQRADLVHGAVLGEDALALRFFCAQGDRLLLVNLGRDLTLVPAPEPLLASSTREPWRLVWSSDDPRYGGAGIAPIEGDWGFRVPGYAAVVLG